MIPNAESDKSGKLPTCSRCAEKHICCDSRLKTSRRKHSHGSMDAGRAPGDIMAHRTAIRPMHGSFKTEAEFRCETLLLLTDLDCQTDGSLDQQYTRPITQGYDGDDAVQQTTWTKRSSILLGDCAFNYDRQADNDIYERSNWHARLESPKHLWHSHVDRLSKEQETAEWKHPHISQPYQVLPDVVLPKSCNSCSSRQLQEDTAWHDCGEHEYDLLKSDDHLPTDVSAYDGDYSMINQLPWPSHQEEYIFTSPATTLPDVHDVMDTLAVDFWIRFDHDWRMDIDTPAPKYGFEYKSSDECWAPIRRNVVGQGFYAARE